MSRGSFSLNKMQLYFMFSFIGHYSCGKKWKLLVAQLCLTLCNPTDHSLQAPLSIGFSRQENWNGLQFPHPGDLPNPGIEPASQSADSFQVSLCSFPFHLSHHSASTEASLCFFSFETLEVGLEFKVLGLQLAVIWDKFISLSLNFLIYKW